MKAIETTGIIDARHRLIVDESLPIPGPSRVRVIILVNEEEEISEADWMKAAAINPEFDYLRDTAEDIYTADDGKPFHD